MAKRQGLTKYSPPPLLRVVDEPDTIPACDCGTAGIRSGGFYLAMGNQNTILLAGGWAGSCPLGRTAGTGWGGMAPPRRRGWLWSVQRKDELPELLRHISHGLH